MTLATPRNINEARLQANINSRAARLWEDGYSWELMTGCLAGPWYLVTGPAGQRYNVDPLLGFKCNCKCFENNDVCKHSLAIQQVDADLQAREAAQVAALEESNAWWQEAGFDSPPLYTF